MQGYLFILAAGIINSFVLSLLKLAGLEFAVRELVMPDGFVRMAVYYIYVCVLPPLLEEIFVRGYVLNALKGYGVTFAVVASSVCFALMHSSLENFVVYFACGVILAMVYLTFDSLLPAMALHWVNNSISFFLAFYRQKVNAVSALSLTVFVYVFVLIMGFVGHRLLARHDIMLTDCLSKETDAKGKLRQFGKSYVAITALALLLFLSAVGSYNSLI